MRRSRATESPRPNMYHSRTLTQFDATATPPSADPGSRSKIQSRPVRPWSNDTRGAQRLTDTTRCRTLTLCHRRCAYPCRIGTRESTATGSALTHARGALASPVMVRSRASTRMECSLVESTDHGRPPSFRMQKHMGSCQDASHIVRAGRPDLKGSLWPQN